MHNKQVRIVNTSHLTHISWQVSGTHLIVKVAAFHIMYMSVYYADQQ